MFASGAAYNKASRACIGRNHLICPSVGWDGKSSFGQRLARHFRPADNAILQRTGEPAKTRHGAGGSGGVNLKWSYLPQSVPAAGASWR
jgi:hypothetical protein